MNIFKEITDSYRQLYLSFIESGFSEEQAFELTKEFCENTIANNMLDYQHRYIRKNPHIEHLRKYMQERSAKNESPKPEIKEENL